MMCPIVSERCNVFEDFESRVFHSGTCPSHHINLFQGFWHQPADRDGLSRLESIQHHIIEAISAGGGEKSNGLDKSSETSFKMRQDEDCRNADYPGEPKKWQLICRRNVPHAPGEAKGME
jgi:hypothetical protein